MSYKSVRQQLLLIAAQPLPEGEGVKPTLESKVAGARRIELEPPMYMGEEEELFLDAIKRWVKRGWAEAQMFVAKLQGG